MPWLGPLLVARDETGARRFTDTQAEDFLAALLLSQGVPNPAALPPELSELLVRFATRAAVPPGADRAAADAAVAAYFAAHPIPPGLDRDFGGLYRQTLAELDPAALEQAALQLTGEAAVAKTKAPPGGGPRGPLAFFAARAELDED